MLCDDSTLLLFYFVTLILWCRRHHTWSTFGCLFLSPLHLYWLPRRHFFATLLLDLQNKMALAKTAGKGRSATQKFFFSFPAIEKKKFLLSSHFIDGQSVKTGKWISEEQSQGLFVFSVAISSIFCSFFSSRCLFLLISASNDKLSRFSAPRKLH